jgi:hypothetical protein
MDQSEKSANQFLSKEKNSIDLGKGNSLSLRMIKNYNKLNEQSDDMTNEMILKVCFST